MELTRDQVSKLIDDAVKADREVLINHLTAKESSRLDIDSPDFNTNFLFHELQKRLKSAVNDSQVENHLYKESQWGNQKYVYVYGRLINDKIRELTLALFNVNANCDIPINERRSAQIFYKKVSDLFIEEFAYQCDMQNVASKS